jgi:hypothetical protein
MKGLTGCGVCRRLSFSLVICQGVLTPKNIPCSCADVPGTVIGIQLLPTPHHSLGDSGDATDREGGRGSNGLECIVGGDLG